VGLFTICQILLLSMGEEVSISCWYWWPCFYENFSTSSWSCELVILFWWKFVKTWWIIFKWNILSQMFFVEKKCLKSVRNLFWGRASSHLSSLVTILRIPWNNVTSQVEIYLGMFATLAPSRIWKTTLVLLMWDNTFAHKHSNFNPTMWNFHSFYVDHLILMWNNNTM
jgi:hypothetical protein